MPASYFFQDAMIRTFFAEKGQSLPAYLKAIPDFITKIHQNSPSEIQNIRNTIVWTAVGFIVGGFVLGELIKLVISASQRSGESA